MVKRFKMVSYLEGLSFLLLLGVAMPLKYVYGMPIFVRVIGMAHGFLFIAYLILLQSLAIEKGWSTKTKALGFMAAVLPFGPFVFDRKFLK